MSGDLKKDKSLECMTHSWETWDFVTRQAGLDTNKYDKDLVRDVCKHLDFSSSCENISDELRKKNVSQELLIGAILKAIRPYAHMMVDLCAFFCAYGIRGTNRSLRILFNFSDGPEDLGFDLRNFREFIYKYSRISQSIAVSGWSYQALCKLGYVLHRNWKYEPHDVAARNWLVNYNNRKLTIPLPSLPSSRDTEAGEWLERTWQVLESIILECSKYTLNLDELQECEDRQKRSTLDSTHAEPTTNELFPNLADWSLHTLNVLNSDFWPEDMIRGLFGYAESLSDSTLAEEERNEITRQLKELFSRIPHWKSEKETLVQELLELLRLPIWNRRHELYQTWVMTQIDSALSAFERTIHQVDGELLLSFSGTHIGTAETELGRVHIWSEMRSPFANPIGKGRKAHIQPDYSLTLEPVTSPSQTLVAIECKQYLKASSKNFSNAIMDYARGRPNAKIILVNYGDVPRRIFHLIDPNVRDRVIIIGNFVPRRPRETSKFTNEIRGSLNKPAVLGESEKEYVADHFDLLCVDISGSMKQQLEEEVVLRLLHMLVHFSPTAKLLAIDTAVREEWQKAESDLPKLLKLPRSGGTDLPAALSGRDLERAVVLTDSEGFSQLSSTQQPQLVIEVQTEATFRFHINS